MTEQVRSDWFITASGRRVFALDPDPTQITIEDIAHALSNICRFGGHSRVFYSVAQHSVHVSRLVPAELAKAGLMHDATEAYCGDVIRPIKRQLGSSYANIEAAWWAAICKRFDLLDFHLLPEQVKHADHVALMTERRDLVPAHAHRWIEDERGYQRDAASIVPWSPLEARVEFLTRWTELAR